MRRKKISLAIIIFFLAIFSPLAVMGFIHKNNQNLLDENPGHDRYFKGYIWFYDENDNYLNKYQCLTESCKLSVSTIDDDKYDINYYKDGIQEEIGLINNHYTFITDGVFNYLYDVQSGTTMQKYKTIKNYNTKIGNNLFIVQNENNLWGVLQINDMLNAVLPFEYDFIGLKNDIDDVNNTLMAEKFIVSKDSKWYLVNGENSAISGEMNDPIIDYTSGNIFIKDNGRIRIFSYDDTEYLENMNIIKYYSLSNCIGIITDTKYLYIYKNIMYPPNKEIYLNDLSDITIENNGNIITIKSGESIIDTVEI